MATTMGREVLATCSATIDRAEAEGIALLGFNVYWSLRGVKVTRDKLLELLEEYGFERFAPNVPTAKKALKRAIRVWADGRGIASTEGDDDGDEVSGRRQLLREIPTRSKGDEDFGPPPIVLALVNEEALGRALGLRFGIDHRFYYQPKWGGVEPGNLLISPMQSGPIADEARQIREELEPIWEEHRLLYLNGDISRIVTSIVEQMDSYPLRDGGGAYHVPVDRAEELDRLAAFIRALPARDYLGRVPRLGADAVPDWPSTRANLQEQAFDKLVSEIKDAEWNVKRSEDQNEEKPGSVRPRTVQGLVGMISEVKRRADFVAEKIGMRSERAERLLGDIEGLADRASALFPKEDVREQRADQALATIDVTFDLGTPDRRMERDS